MKKIFSSMVILFLFLFANVNAKTVTDLTGKKLQLKTIQAELLLFLFLGLL